MRCHTTTIAAADDSLRVRREDAARLSARSRLDSARPNLLVNNPRPIETIMNKALKCAAFAAVTVVGFGVSRHDAR